METAVTNLLMHLGISFRDLILYANVALGVSLALASVVWIYVRRDWSAVIVPLLAVVHADWTWHVQLEDLDPFGPRRIMSVVAYAVIIAVLAEGILRLYFENRRLRHKLHDLGDEEDA